METIKEIRDYSLYWGIDNHHGFLELHTMDDRAGYGIRIENPSEIMLIVDMLRNEKPCYYDTTSRTVSTSRKPMRQEES
jgi:hypothetical protein